MKKRLFSHGIAMAIPAMFAITAHAQKPLKYFPVSQHHAKNDQVLRIEDDSTLNPVQTIVTYKDERNTYDFTLAQGKMIELYVDDRLVPADSFYLYNAMVNMVQQQIKQDKLQVIADQQQAAGDREQFERDRQHQQRDRQHQQRDKQHQQRDKEQEERDMQKGENSRVQGEQDRMMMENILADIVKEHIAADKKSVNTITLDGDMFIVNGKPQTETMFKKFKAKYIKQAGFSFYYIGDGSHQTFRYINENKARENFKKDAHK